MLVILVGKSGVGKTTLINKLTKCGFSTVPSYTTRPPRQFDDKISIPEKQFIQMSSEFIEYVHYHGHYYGRKKSDILKAKHTNIVIDLESSGIPIYVDFCKYHEIPYLVVYLKCPEEIRLKRVDKIRSQRDDSYFDSYVQYYDLVFDTSKFNIDFIAQTILEYTKKVNGVIEMDEENKFKINKISQDTIEFIKSIFPNYIETYDNWIRVELLMVPTYMIGFDWKKSVKEVGIDALMAEFVRRGYKFTKYVQTFDYELNGQPKKLKLIIWMIDKKIY